MCVYVFGNGFRHWILLDPPIVRCLVGSVVYGLVWVQKILLTALSNNQRPLRFVICVDAFKESMQNWIVEVFANPTKGSITDNMVVRKFVLSQISDTAVHEILQVLYEFFNETHVFSH